jgi:hypothetical protein
MIIFCRLGCGPENGKEFMHPKFQTQYQQNSTKRNEKGKA